MIAPGSEHPNVSVAQSVLKSVNVEKFSLFDQFSYENIGLSTSTQYRDGLFIALHLINHSIHFVDLDTVIDYYYNLDMLVEYYCKQALSVDYHNNVNELTEYY